MEKGPNIWKAAFLRALSEHGNVSRAVQQAEVGRRTVYDARDADPEFALAWKEALDTASDALEAEARRRAVDGVDEPVFYQGARCGTVRRYSDALLIFLLKGNKPEKFKDRQELTGKDGVPVVPAFVTVYMPDNGRDDRDSPPAGAAGTLPSELG